MEDFQTRRENVSELTSNISQHLVFQSFSSELYAIVRFMSGLAFMRIFVCFEVLFELFRYVVILECHHRS